MEVLRLRQLFSRKFSHLKERNKQTKLLASSDRDPPAAFPSKAFEKLRFSRKAEESSNLLGEQIRIKMIRHEINHLAICGCANLIFL